MGLPADGELRRPVDEQLRPIVLPPDGLVLNTKLAEILGARPGDIVTIEVLEGSRPVRRIAVAGLVDEPVGLGVYMRGQRTAPAHAGGRHYFRRLSQGRYQGCTKALFGLEAQPLFISGVGVREAMLASFGRHSANPSGSRRHSWLASLP